MVSVGVSSGNLSEVTLSGTIRMEFSKSELNRHGNHSLDLQP